MSTRLLLIYIGLLSYISEVPAKVYDVSSFKEAVNTLYDVCDAHFTCAGIISDKPTFCCGSCECDWECFEYGSCCLGFYDNFTHARISMDETRYSCIYPQFLPADQSDYTTIFSNWLITKCDKDYKNNHDIALCESPGTTLEAMVPVSEILTNRNFKNRHCAYCNHVATNTLLFEWKLKIVSKQFISFPRNDLLDIIRQTRGNIHFSPPEYVDDKECLYVPEYTISKCNETGLWEKYNADIELACNSYLDPFNYTYKNFFCFLCNAEESALGDDFVCPSRDRLTPRPPVSGLYDLNFVVKGKSSDSLICEGNQFADKKMGVCREVLCNELHVLDLGRCLVLRRDLNETCYSVFLKLLPRGDTPTLDTLNQASLTYAIERKLKFLSADNETPSNEIKRQITLFYKTNVSGHIEYVVANIDSVFRVSNDKVEFLDDLLTLQNRELRYAIDVLGLKVELAIYNLTVSDHNTKLLVPNTVNNTFDELTAESNFFGENICFGEEKIYLSKVQICPYIKLRIGEIPMNFELDSLQFLDPFADNAVIKKLSRWEYERQDDSIKICLKDYLIINNAFTRSQSNLLSSAKMIFLNRLLYLNLVFLYTLLIHNL